MKTRLFI